MTRRRESAASTAAAGAMLRRATLAESPRLRAKYAKRALSSQAKLDRTTRSMLLRQLYLAHMEGRRFDEALRVARQMITVGVMPDVAQQDAARACLALSQQAQALAHLRLASRVGPPSRRAFHLWTLGSVLYLAGRHQEAAGALCRAVRWGTTDRPLYRAQLALARLAGGIPVDNLRSLRDCLLEAPCSQGYGQFVLGELACYDGDHEAARKHLNRFLRRSTAGRVALAVALAAEIRRARKLLEQLKRTAQ